VDSDRERGEIREQVRLPAHEAAQKSPGTLGIPLVDQNQHDRQEPHEGTDENENREHDQTRDRVEDPEER
jgi:hypothetical protein